MLAWGRLACLVTGLLLVATQLGCATMRGESAYNTRLSSLVYDHVYSEPCVNIERTARRVLFDDGFTVVQSDGLHIETRWQTSSDEDAYQLERYLIILTEGRGPTCQVQARLATRSADRTQRDERVSRDWEFEYVLLRAHDRQSAATYERSAREARECAAQELDC